MIVRLFTSGDASTGDGLHGVLEVPGAASTPFTTVGELVARLEELAREQRAQPWHQRTNGPALSPPEDLSGW